MSGMSMLTKFESKSNRVKGIAFHPTLTILAASLHSGSIQIWNYQMGTLVARYDDHDGPVRGICFHPTQPLFASGGDDYKIRVFNYKTQRCLFTLHGHLDYVRTVFFHNEHPWILSASDDQTIRIWNWQSRQCIAILTGHNHYIMCAQFHPKEDYVVSASMDQTVRVWDISGLRKKSTTAQPMTFEDQVQRANAQTDLFGNTDAVVKYVLEGHDRGVNWAAFHPTLPLIVSAGDDRQIKLWRMSDTKAWEVDTCRGHFNNVSCALFHPKHELIISDSEDKTIRVWDMSKRTAVQTFRRENDRFWVLTAHPELNLFAAGHDSGLIVFKLDRERPAFSIHQNMLFYIRDKTVRAHDLTTGTDASVLSVRRLGSQFIQPRTISYNPAERAVIVTSPADNGIYELVSLPKDGAEPSEGGGKRGAGQAALFVARNRFAVLDKNAQTIDIRDLNNNVTKTIRCPSTTNDIFYGGTASLLLSTPSSVVLYDIQQQKVLAELATPPVKYVVWSNDGSHVALLSKHTIMLATKNLAQSALIHETIRIKSGAWDDSGVFVYSTLNHIKYALPQGDNGIIKTLEQPVYLTRVKGRNVYCLDRNAKARVLPIDPTEYRFKLALLRRNYEEVLHIIKTSNLVGQSIIAYLSKKGYPEIALHFVQDKSTRFDLAIECGNLEVALDTAKALDREECWNRLAQQALKQGNHKIVEIAYQRTKNFDRLSFLYLITGNPEKLAKMSKIAEMRGDLMSKFHNSLFLGDAAGRASVLRDVGLAPLAYLTAKTSGLDDLAQEILDESDATEEQIASLPKTTGQSNLAPPPAVTATDNFVWPTVGVEQSFFDKALQAAAEGTSFEMAVDAGERELDGLEEWAGEPEEAAQAEEAEEAWDLAAEEPEQDEELYEEDAVGAAEPEDVAAPGISESELWVRNSPLAADHVAAGSFETAMQLLNRQAGVVQFNPLKPIFLSVYQSSKLVLPASASLPPLEVHLRRNPDETEGRSVLPVVARSLASVSAQIKSAYASFRKAAFAEAAATFRSVLQSLLLVVASTAEEEAEIRELVITCREYILGITLEMERRKTQQQEPDNVKRQLELAAYFTHCGLRPADLALALRLAMVQFKKPGNNATAAVFAQRLIDIPIAHDPKVVTQAKQAIALADRNPRDAVEIDYDHFTNFSVCAGSLTPIYSGAPSVLDPFTGTIYKPEYKGTVCRISEISEVGKSASGFRVMA